MKKNMLPCMREWAETHLDAPKDTVIQKLSKAIEAMGGTVTVFTSTTDLEAKAIRAIEPGMVTYVVGTSTKRFARQIQGAAQLTDKQRAYIWAIVWKYRRQIADKTLVEHARTLENQERDR